MSRCETAPEPMRTDRHSAVTVHAPGRLHLGFFDPAASLGRAFGSLGLVIEGFETVVSVGSAPRDTITADTPAAQAELARAGDCLEALRRHTGLHQALHVRLMQVLPAHAGFGSGTQLALAIGHAFAHWHGLSLDSAVLARWLGRGARSGIGIAGFDQGGLLVDGGPAADGAPAPLLARLALPDAWRVIVIQHAALRGLSGEREKRAIETIAAIAPLSRAAAADICHQVLMRVLPGAACADFAPFAAGVTRVQQVLGDHFAPAQGGSAYASAAVGRLVQWFFDASRGAAIGQSSWGPTGFVIVASQAEADTLVSAARSAGLIGPELCVSIVRGRNQGARIVDARARPPG